LTAALVRSGIGQMLSSVAMARFVRRRRGRRRDIVLRRLWRGERTWAAACPFLLGGRPMGRMRTIDRSNVVPGFAHHVPGTHSTPIRDSRQL